MIDSKKAIWSWAVYDWANSAFAVTIMAGFFPLFFKTYWASQANVTESTFYLGLANSTASILIAALTPILGAIADRWTAKKRFLTLFVLLGIVCSGSLYMVHQGMWQLAAALFILATIGFMGGNTFYDSLLPGVASKSKIDYTSSLGFSLGYLGGGLIFAVNVVMALNPELFGIPSQELAVKISFLSVAVWWGVFSIPILLWVEEPVNYKAEGLFDAVKQGLQQIRETIQQIKHLKIIGIFLLAYWLYIDGVDTIIRMAVDYGVSIGFPSSVLMTSLLLVQFVAFPATLLFYWFTSKIGPKNAVLIAILAYCVLTILGSMISQTWHFYGMAVGIAMFQGGIQAISRSLYSRIIPKEKAAQYFGLYNMMGKFAAVIGPALMGTITLVTGNNRMGILSVLLLFIPGFFILLKVDFDEGERMAQTYLSDR